MNDLALLQLFKDLFGSTRPEDVKAILTSLGDSHDVGNDEPFGPHHFIWHPFGDTLSNGSSIGLATKPGRSITERLTNAIDAVLERRASQVTGNPPDSPGLAAERWFGRPISGSDTGLFEWKYAQGAYEKQFVIVLLPSGQDDCATIDVIDRGIGIRNDALRTTILSLQQGNKISKRYLAGAYGQGGASTLSFCEYALVISRHQDDPDRVSFTVIRILNLSDDYKVDAYAYLAFQTEHGVVIPSCTVHGDIKLYSDRAEVIDMERSFGQSWSHGTLVRHYGYRLSQLDGKLGPQAGNLYHFLQISLFDPLLPFRIIDLRESTRFRREIILGSRNRLMKRLSSSATEDGEENADAQDSNIQIKHHRPMEYFTPHGGSAPSIGIEYWVVYAFRKGKDGKGMDLRGFSNELFVHKSYPIVGTVNGQNQGELSAQLIREVGLPLLSRHMVVHIDASKVGSRVIRELFSTNREGFKEGPVLTDLQKGLQAMLKDDSRLEQLERELTDSIAKHHSQSASDEVKRQVTSLLLDSGLKPQDAGPTSSPGEGDPQVVRPIRPGPVIPQPLATLPYPEVTKWEIVTPRNDFKLAQDDVRVTLIETDADTEFDRRGMLAIRIEPPIVEVFSKSGLKGGRIRWRLKGTQSATIGAKFSVIATFNSAKWPATRFIRRWGDFSGVGRNCQESKGSNS